MLSFCQWAVVAHEMEELRRKLVSGIRKYIRLRINEFLYNSMFVSG